MPTLDRKRLDISNARSFTLIIIGNGGKIIMKQNTDGKDEPRDGLHHYIFGKLEKSDSS